MAEVTENTSTEQTLTEKEKKKNARKAKNQKNWKETMGVLDAAQTALNNYPELENIGLDINFNYLGNPLIFLFTILKHTKGMDWVYRLVGDVITPLCPVLEYSVKATFTARLIELLSCTLSNMRISKDLINNGFTINLKDVDLLNILAYSPLSNENTSSMEYFKVKKKDAEGNIVTDDKGNPVMESISSGPSNIGRYFYFGCDDFEKADDLIFSPDFNALLWYVKNRANGRVVWYGSKYQSEGRGDDATNIEIEPTQTLSKRDGIITLEYHGNGKSLRKADGSTYYLQSPTENCLHVFIGNVSEKPKGHSYVATKKENKRRVGKLNKAIAHYNNLITKLEKQKEYIEQLTEEDFSAATPEKVAMDVNNIDGYIKKLKAGHETVKSILGVTKPKIKFKTPAYPVIFEKDILEESLDSLNNQVKTELTSGNAMDYNNESVYRDPEQNYYYQKFLMTFNTDYIWSVKLFDPKVVAAQLIDALTGCVSVDLGLSVETQILKAEVEHIVEEVCNDDSYEINDCFFTFTNDGYNALLEKAELAKMGLIILENDYSTITKSDAVDLLSGLDAVGEKIENKDAISETLYNVSLKLNNEKDSLQTEVGGKMSFSFLENIMNKLATVIVTSVVSPKLYIMLLVNFQIMKLNTHFDIATFITHYKQILIAIIRDVRDQLVKVFTDKVMEIVKDLIKELTAVMAMEQLQYYKKLIMSCMDCINIQRRSNDWTMAQVDYADIRESENNDTQDDNNC